MPFAPSSVLAPTKQDAGCDHSSILGMLIPLFVGCDLRTGAQNEQIKGHRGRTPKEGRNARNASLRKESQTSPPTGRARCIPTSPSKAGSRAKSKSDAFDAFKVCFECIRLCFASRCFKRFLGRLLKRRSAGCKCPSEYPKTLSTRLLRKRVICLVRKLCQVLEADHGGDPAG